jgi:ACT domain-containing protein
LNGYILWNCVFVCLDDSISSIEVVLIGLYMCLVLNFSMLQDSVWTMQFSLEDRVGRNSITSNIFSKLKDRVGRYSLVLNIFSKLKDRVGRYSLTLNIFSKLKDRVGRYILTLDIFSKKIMSDDTV